MLPVTEGRILGHLPLVQHVVERICMSIPKHIDRGDLFQVGVIGLIEALTWFDETLNCKFSTYAVLRIRGQILDELRDRDWVPRGARDRSERYQGVKEELTHALGRAPLEEELATRLGTSVDNLSALEREAVIVAQVSYDAPVDRDHPGGRAPRLPADDEQTNPARRLEKTDHHRILTRLRATLAPQEQQVIQGYYFENRTMKEIAAALGVTESRICQIHGQILATLRARARALDMAP